MLISVITVNLNNASGIESTIKSVINQTNKNYEYLIIDGKSTDRSVEVIKYYDSHIHYWVSEPDYGIYHAMNKGIHNAKAEYLIFLNSGDCFFSSEVLEEFASSNPDQDVISGDILIEYSDSHKKLKKSPDSITAKYLINDYLPHGATFIKRSFIEKCGPYNENYRIISDWEFFLRAFLIYNASYLHFNKCISIFKTNGISCREENAEIIQKERDLILRTTIPYFYQDYKYLEKLEAELEFTRSLKRYNFFSIFKNKNSLV